MICSALLTNLKGDCLVPETRKTEKNDENFQKPEMRIFFKKNAEICDIGN